VEFDSCPLMHEEINRIFRNIKEHGLAQGLKELHLCVGSTAAALLKHDGDKTCLPEHFRTTGIASIICNDALTEGAGYIELPLPGLNYTVSPQTFFQAHWALNIKVAECIMGEAAPLTGKTVLDLYAGAGNFSLPLAGQAGDVVLVEENPHAIEDGTRNVKLNRLRNCRFVKSSAEKYRMQKKVDLLILDPPRPGLTTEVVKKILEHAPDRIIYISCNPSTLARDLKKLKGTYDITSVRLIDFFPNTYHIEALVFLRAR
jgi:23S rRNA (uracil1939-C5)-methyltransferase